MNSILRSLCDLLLPFKDVEDHEVTTAHALYGLRRDGKPDMLKTIYLFIHFKKVS